MKSFKVIASVLLVALLIAGFIPRTTLGAPDWTITVVDESGAPVQGALVREIYRNYSAESEGHEVDQQSDANGRAHFSKQMTRASSFQRLIRTISSATAFVHASFGPHAYVLAFDGSKSGDVIVNGYVFDWVGSPEKLESAITLK